MKQIINGLDDDYCSQRLPNFISIDYVDKGDAMKQITALMLSPKD